MSKRKHTGSSTPRAARRAAARAAAARGPSSRGRLLNRAVAGVLVAIVIGVIATAIADSGKSSASGGQVKEGALAPEGSFTTTAGATRTIASLSGRPTLLWFVTTWCSSCQTGTQAMASEIIGRLAEHHVQVVEVENAEDLGQEGPSMTSFASHLAGPQANNPDWTFGVASSALTKTYNPEGSLDVYYLLSAQRQIAYINSSPAATKAQLLAEAEKVGSNA